MLTVACVLRSGGDFDTEYVQRLKGGVYHHNRHNRFVCLSDVDVPNRIPLRHNWPGWYSKIEIFRPDIKGDILYFDLDTIILGPIDIPQRLTLLSDFYKPEMANTGVMFIPHADKRKAWEAWIKDPEGWMAKCGSYGDGHFIRQIYPDAARWGPEIVSYKAHVMKRQGHRYQTGNGSVPPHARVVCFHGHPRPHEIGWNLNER